MDERYFTELLEESRSRCKEFHFPSHLMQTVVDGAKTYQAAISRQQQVQAELHKMQREKKASKEEMDAKAKENEDAKDAYIAMEPGYEESIKPALQYLTDNLHKDSNLVSALMKCAILHAATPKYLAQFVSEDPTTHGELLRDFLENDVELQKNMLLNGGPTNGRWAHAVKIYKTQVFPLVPQDKPRWAKILRKLAMAIALEHATPIQEYDTPDIFVDPAKRFDSYYGACRRGQLDPAFEHFSIWEYRYILDSNAPDEQLAWGRQCMYRYRPDQACQRPYKWRYAEAVKSDVGYRTPRWESSPRTYIQMISGGGKCGPRAQYGRFIIKAFGCPTWGVRQPGHAALSRWTPHGWVTILGAGWPFSNWEGRKGMDFMYEAHARSYCFRDEERYYQTVTLLECMAHVHNENYRRSVDSNFCHPEFPWFTMMRTQRHIYAGQATAEHFAREGKNLVTTRIEKYLKRTDKPQDDKEIVIKDDLVSIPSNAFTNSGGVLRFNHIDEGGQIFFPNQNAWAEYTMPDSLPDGEYNLRFHLVNVHTQQTPLSVTVNGEQKVKAVVQYTRGGFKGTKFVKIKVGPNSKIRVSREADQCWGLAIQLLELHKVLGST